MTFSQLLHLFATGALVGLIWTIQLVHYPSFHFVSEQEFLAFHRHHSRSITTVVMPLMLLELGLAFWNAYAANWHWTWLLPLIGVLLIWAITFVGAVPLHQQLGVAKATPGIDRLVFINWSRTVLWTLMGVWLLYIIWRGETI